MRAFRSHSFLAVLLLISFVPGLLAADEAPANANGRIEGRVIDADTHEPIRGAEVGVFPGSTWWLGDLDDVGITIVAVDSEGRFSATVRAHEMIRLKSRAPGHGPVVRSLVLSVRPGETVRGVTVRMRKSPILKVRVTHRGRGVPGARVMLSYHLTGRGDATSTFGRDRGRLTDGDGLAVFDDIWRHIRGTLRIVAVAKGHESVRKEIFWRGDDSREVTLRLGDCRTRRLTVKCDGETVEDGYVVLSDHPFTAYVDGDNRVLETAKLPSMRVYDLQENGVAEYWSNRAPRFLTVVSERVGVRTVEPEFRKDMTVYVSPGPRWRGRCLDEDGAPVAGVIAMISDIMGGGGRGPIFHSVSDGNGRFSLPRCEDDEWQECLVEFVHPDYDWRRDHLEADAENDIVLRRRRNETIGVEITLPFGTDATHVSLFDLHVRPLPSLDDVRAWFGPAVKDRERSYSVYGPKILRAAQDFCYSEYYLPIEGEIAAAIPYTMVHKWGTEFFSAGRRTLVTSRGELDWDIFDRAFEEKLPLQIKLRRIPGLEEDVPFALP